MQWEQIVLVVFFMFSSLAVVSRIGIKRDPLTPADAIAVILFNALIVILILRIGS